MAVEFEYETWTQSLVGLVVEKTSERVDLVGNTSEIWTGNRNASVKWTCVDLPFVEENASVRWT